MTIDPSLIIAGLIIGTLVGLTGMGGGALMTPILVLFFNVPTLAAISSDLVVSLFMKPAGAVVHIVRRTVNWRLVLFLCIGSIPGALLGAWLISAIPVWFSLDADQLSTVLKIVLGVVLLIATAGLITRVVLQMVRNHTGAGEGAVPFGKAEVRLRLVPTVALGVFAGVMVGMTSVGAGSIIIVALLLMYPALKASQLVGTDLVQAIPLVAAAALGHVFFGEIQLTLVASLLIGAIPGAFLGGQISSRVHGGWIRRVLAILLLASALKLLNVDTTIVIVIAVAAFVGGNIAWAIAKSRLAARTTRRRAAQRADAADVEVER